MFVFGFKPVTFDCSEYFDQKRSFPTRTRKWQVFLHLKWMCDILRWLYNRHAQNWWAGSLESSDFEEPELIWWRRAWLCLSDETPQKHKTTAAIHLLVYALITMKEKQKLTCFFKVLVDDIDEFCNSALVKGTVNPKIKKPVIISSPTLM